MPFLFFFLLLIVGGVSLVVGIVSVALLFFGWKRKKKWMLWAGGIPMAGLLTGGIVVAIAIAWGTYLSHSPPYVFKKSFGFEAPDSTKFESGYLSVFGDSGTAELKFFTDTNTFQTIITTGFVQVPKREFDNEAKLHPGNPTRFFKKDPFGKNFGHDVAYIAIDDATGLIHFYWLGID